MVVNKIALSVTNLADDIYFNISKRNRKSLMPAHDWHIDFDLNWTTDRTVNVTSRDDVRLKMYIANVKASKYVLN